MQFDIIHPTADTISIPEVIHPPAARPQKQCRSFPFYLFGFSLWKGQYTRRSTIPLPIHYCNGRPEQHGENNTQNNWLRSFKLNDGEELVTDLQYLRVMLVVFEAVSGLKVNWRKSNISPIKEVSSIQTLAGMLGCRVDKLRNVYLGMPLGNRHKDVEIWNSIIEKTMKRLSQWKTQYLSLGERVTLINCLWLTAHLCDVLVPYAFQCGKEAWQTRKVFFNVWKGNKGKLVCQNV